MSVSMVAIFYIVILTFGILGAWQRGTRPFYLLAYAANLAATCWLLFLFGALSSEYRGLTQPDPWMRWVCFLIGVLLIPVTVVGLVRGERARHREMADDERKAALEEMRRRYPAATAILVIAVFWMVFIGEGTFGYFRSHFWLIVLGIAASVVVGWIVVTLINHRRLSHKGAAS
jgi:hypothetical protein